MRAQSAMSFIVSSWRSEPVVKPRQKVRNNKMWYLKRDDKTFLLKVWKMVKGKVEETSPVSQKGQALVEVKDVKACSSNEMEVEVSTKLDKLCSTLNIFKHVA